MSDLLFFPMSMPDEMLHSRITRYHFLSGNRTAGETFRDLFGSEPFSVGMLPKQIEVLADRLPGDTASNLDELICTNTTFPAYRPFLGVSEEAETAASGYSFSGVARLPRREGVVHGKAKLCPTCVQQDLLEVGYSYWHRSHHLPGVSVCWRHGDLLMYSCPKCFHPFFRGLRMLPSLTEPCVCGWSVLANAPLNKGTDLEKKLAEFAHQLLQRNLPLMSSETLRASYVKQCRKRGFIHGQFVGTAKLFDSIRDKYGDEYLSRIDKAYESGKHHQWIRFNVSKSQLDMPVARHIIIALHLFGSIDEFEASLSKEAMLKLNPLPRSVSLPKHPKLGTKEKFRQKVTTVLAFRGGASLETLWKNAYKATRWLYENEKVWLMAKLSTPKNDPAKVEESCDCRDSAFAAILLEGVEGLYEISKGQKRVNITNLQKLLPTRLPPDPSTRKRRFPLASQQMEFLLESVWHFRLRRLICAMDDLTKLNLPISAGNIREISTVPPQIIPVIISFFEWDIESFSKNGFDPEVLLQSTGVPKDWQGPPGFNLALGGSAYVSKSKSRLLQKAQI